MKISFSPPKSPNSINNNKLDASSGKTGTESGQALHLSDNTLFTVLSDFCKEKKMSLLNSLPFINYLPPRLTQGKEWYVSYYVLDPRTKKMKRFKVKLNRAGDDKQKKAMAKAVIAELTQKLALGWNPIFDKCAPKAHKKLVDVFDAFIDAKSKELESNSIRCYKSFIKILKNWLEQSRIGKDAYVYDFDSTAAVEIMNDIEARPDVSARTYNNYLLFFRVLFDWMMERGYCSENPFGKIRRKTKRLTTKKRRLFNDEELQRLWAFLEQRNNDYLLMCMLCYCCLIRPKEIALLKCSDIDLKKQTVRVRAEIAKNDNNSIRTIPDKMMPYLLKANLSNGDNFLFGHHSGEDFSPSKKHVLDRKIGTYWSTVVRKECDFPMELTFYSLKDTGITNMIASGVPVSFVQQQADHSSLEMTSIYCQRSGKATEELKSVDVLNIGK